MKIKDLLEKNKIGKEKIILLLLAGILLIAVSYFENIDENGEQIEQRKETINKYDSKNVEEKIKKIVASIGGIEDVEVMVTYKNDGEKILKEDYEKSQDNKQDESSINEKKSTVILKNSSEESPVIVSNNTPSVEGIAIVAKGVNQNNNRENIFSMMSALFNVPIHKIAVFEK